MTDSRATSPTGTASTLLPLAIITLTVILLYLPTSSFPFVNLDDDVYVYNNQQVSHGLTVDGIKWAFQPNAKNGSYWHPLAWISLMVDVEIFGVNPVAHHTTNWLIHLANAILLFYLIKNTTGHLWRSTLIATIFAVHPINLESVVWIAERKNVLSTLFFLITLLAYTHHVTKQTLSSLLATLFFYILGLLTKPMLVTLPAILLLLDFWPLQRYDRPNSNQPRHISGRIKYFLSNNRRLLFEKIPFFILAAMVVFFCTLAISTQGIGISFGTVPLPLRIENLFTSFVAYLFKLIYPINLAVFYPFPARISYWLVIPAALFLTTLTGLALLNRKHRPWFTAGWFWFLITLSPVTGITQAGLWPRMADRWMYLPEIGVLIIFSWGITELADRLNTRNSYRAYAAVTVLLLLLSLSFKQVQYWRNSTSLMEHSLSVGGSHPVILTNLGGALLEAKKPLPAIIYLDQAIKMAPENASTLSNLGVAYAQLNNLDSATTYFEHALKNDPALEPAMKNLSLIAQRKQRAEEMAAATLASLAHTPDSPELLNRLGSIYFSLGKIQPAIDSYEKSLRLQPNNPVTYNELGVIYMLYDRTGEAILFFKEALRLDRNFAEARQNLTIAEGIIPAKKQ